MRLRRCLALPSVPNRLSVAVAALCATASAASWAAGGVVISQVFAGGGNAGAPYQRDYVELFNAGSTPVSLGGMSVQYASGTGTGFFSANSPVALANVTLQPGQFFLLALASGSNGAALTADQVIAASQPNLSASGGKVALVSGTAGLQCNGSTAQPCTTAQLAQIVDLVGYGSANFAEGAAAAAPGNTQALVRAAGGCSDSNDNSADLSAGTPAPRTTASPLAACGTTPVNAPIALSCPSLAVAAGTAGAVELTATDADSRVQAVSITSGAVTGLALGALAVAAADGETARVQLQAAASVPPGSYSVGVSFSNDDGQTAACTVPVTVEAPAAVTPIPAIQGSGAASPLVGQTVVTQGVVTAVFPGLSGYTLQDEAGDGDERTSDGIFVYSPAGITVSVGDRVRLTATVAEYNAVTELTNPGNLVRLGSGPAPAPKPLSLPVASLDQLEAVEGMLVQVTSPMTVSQNYFQGRYGQVTLAAGGRLYIPTNVHAPGSPEALALADENARRTLVLDDGSSAQNPNPIPFIAQDNTLRAGDAAANLVGVIDFGPITADAAGLRAYKLHATQAPVFTRTNPRTTAPQDVGGNVKLASFNVLNYFTTIDQSGAACAPSNTRSDCRGADSAAEFTRQKAKTVAALAAIDADVVGLMEMQNNGNTAVNDLVAALNAQMGAGTYAAAPLPTGGTGTDAIRVALIYKPGRLTLQGTPVSDTDPIHNRPPLLARFAAANGEGVTVVVNHFKSKGCDGATAADLDQGDGQGCYSARRVSQAQALAEFVAEQVQAGAPAAVVILGDLNSYAQEDPIAALKDRGYTDLIARHGGATAYGYVFDGAAGYLDHALASAAAAARVTGAVEWHINADEPSVLDYNTEFKPQDLYAPTPYRSSDHDPVVLGLKLVKTLLGTAGRDTLTGTPGDDEIIGGEAADTLTGGAGRDTFVLRSLRDAGDVVTDFVPGQDRIDLLAVLAQAGVAPAQAVSRGVVRVADGAGGAAIQIDTDGAAGPLAPRTLLTLRGVSASQIQPARDLGL
ncbi:MAG: ExeM/NucH family extracellular endonuclease [Pseudomonadota bacterium]